MNRNMKDEVAVLHIVQLFLTNANYTYRLWITCHILKAQHQRRSITRSIDFEDELQR